MRVLVTGGAGFIGSHLVEYYLESGHEVHILDDLSTGCRENVTHLLEDPRFNKSLSLTINTVTNRQLVDDLIEWCDLVFHLAAAVGVEYILKYPGESIRTNIEGTENVFRSCAHHKKQVLFTSSSEVYGKHTHAPLLESDNSVYGSPDTFRWSYAASKLMAEYSALAHHRSSGLQVTVVRLFNVVGPRQTSQYGMVVPRLIGQALSGEPLTVYGDGMQTRTFTYIDDVIWVFDRIIRDERTFGNVYNIGGDEEVSIAELARKIVKASGSDSQIRYIPYEIAYGTGFEDVPRRVPGTDKIKKIIGNYPTTSLVSILEKILTDKLSESATC